MSDDDSTPSNIPNDFGFSKMNHDPFPSSLQLVLEDLTTQLVRLVSERARVLARRETETPYPGYGPVPKLFDDKRIQSVAEAIAKLSTAAAWDFVR